MSRHALPPLARKPSEYIRGPQHFQSIQLHEGEQSLRHAIEAGSPPPFRGLHRNAESSPSITPLRYFVSREGEVVSWARNHRNRGPGTNHTPSR